MYDMAHQKALKTGIIAAILLVTVILTAQQQTYATAAAEDGYQQGSNDHNDGKSFNDTCPSSANDAQCALYKGGYTTGWAATEVLHGNDQPRNDYNFDENDNDNDN